MQKLEQLELSGNGLYDIARGAFDGLPELKSLMLGWNPVDVQNMFDNGGQKLEYLGIQEYSFSCLKPEFFDSLPKLRWIFPDVLQLGLG